MKKISAIMAVVGAACTVAVAKPPLQLMDNGIKVEPVRIRTVQLVNGVAVPTGEWIAYNGNSTRAANTPAVAFDCGSFDASGFPTDSVDGCAMGSSRWYFGPSYPNSNTQDDMALTCHGAGMEIDQIDAAWYFYDGDGDGQFLGAQCSLLYFTAEEGLADDCATSPDDFSYNPGVELDFGTIGENPGGYYYTNADFAGALAGNGIILPTTGSGSYRQQIGTDGFLSAVAQPMLWGTRDNGALAGLAGSQGELAFDDDNAFDGALTAPDECYSYLFGVCPDPLGKCNRFSTVGTTLGCGADFNGDGFVTGDDFDAYNANFELGEGLCADYNRDGFVTGDDFDLFVADFEAGC